ncbi:MAG: right-handed parallel beta-helix repeat-containing protein, partial [Candidatus Micrarchaeota archaeon]
MRGEVYLLAPFGLALLAILSLFSISGMNEGANSSDLNASNLSYPTASTIPAQLNLTYLNGTLLNFTNLAGCTPYNLTDDNQTNGTSGNITVCDFAFLNISDIPLNQSDNQTDLNSTFVNQTYANETPYEQTELNITVFNQTILNETSSNQTYNVTLANQTLNGTGLNQTEDLDAIPELLILKEKFKKNSQLNFKSLKKRFSFINGTNTALYDLSFSLPSKNKFKHGEAKEISLSISGIRDLEQLTEPFSAGVPNKVHLSTTENSDTVAYFTTDLMGMENLEFDEAELLLPSSSRTDAILSCDSVNGFTGGCSEWSISDIPFTEEDGAIRFKVNHFSGYAGANITILNVQSYPAVGGDWIVRFTTTGSAPLTVTAIDGTEFGTDLEFKSIMCGENDTLAAFNGTSALVDNYACDFEGSETSTVITSGAHHLQFQFGDAVAYANNSATQLTWYLDNRIHETGGPRKLLNRTAPFTTEDYSESHLGTLGCYTLQWLTPQFNTSAKQQAVTYVNGTLEGKSTSKNIGGTSGGWYNLSATIFKRFINGTEVELGTNNTAIGFIVCNPAWVTTKTYTITIPDGPNSRLGPGELIGVKYCLIKNCTAIQTYETYYNRSDTYIKFYNETVTSCDNLTSSFVMDSNVTNVPSCFVIKANNVILDCNGHSITGTNNGNGIDVGNYNNVVVKNCFISDFTNGIYSAASPDNFSLINSVLKNNYYGVYFGGGTGMLVDSSSVIDEGSIGLFLDGVANVTVTNTTLRNMDSCILGNTYSEYYKVVNTTITNCTSSGVNLVNPFGGNISNNNISGNGVGIQLTGFTFEPNSNRVYSNVIEANSEAGIFLWAFSSGFTLRDNIFENNTFRNNYPTNFWASGADGREIRDNKLNNNVFVAASGGADMNFSYGQNFNLTNNTFNRRLIGFSGVSNATIWDIIRVHTQDSVGTAISSANVSITNATATSNNLYNQISDGSGNTPWAWIKEFSGDYATGANYTTYNFTGNASIWGYFNTSLQYVGSTMSTFQLILKDTIPPANLKTLNPTLANGSFTNKNWVLVNFSFVEHYPSICWVFWGNGTFKNLSLSTYPEIGLSTFMCTLNITGQSDGLKNYTIWANDTSGNAGTNGTTFFVYVDTTLPSTIKTIPPTLPQNSFTKLSAVNITYTFTETNPERCWIQFYAGSWTNRTFTPNGTMCTLNITGLSSGAYQYNFGLMDKAGNNGTNGTTFTFTVDTTAPSSVKTVPPTLSSGSFSSSNSFYVNITFTETNPQSCWTYLTNATGSFNLSMTRDGVNCYLNITGQSDGAKSYTIWVNDSAGNLGTNTSTFSITVDTAPPSSVRTIPPTLPNGAYTATNSVYVNTTFTETNPSSCWVRYNNVNYTMTRVGNNCYYDFTSQSDGTKSYTIWAQDSAGNVGTNGTTFTAIVDTTSPSNIVTAAPTLPSGSYTDSNSVYVGITFTETNPSNCWLRFDSTNYSMTRSGNTCYRTQTSVSEGSHSYTVWVNDTVGHIATNALTYTVIVDTIDPSSIKTVPPTLANGSLSANNWAFVNMTFTETNPYNCWTAFTNATGTYNLFMTRVGTNCYLNITGQSDGDKTYRIWANDSAGNSAQNGTLFAISLDANPPSDITTVPPTLANDSFTNNNWLFVNITFTEANPSLCWLTYNNGSLYNYSMTRVGTNCYLNLTDQPESTWNYTVWVNDTSGGIGTNGTLFWATLDASPPSNLKTVSPTLANNSFTLNNWVEVNFTFTEFNPSICWLYWNNGSAYNISTTSVNNWCYFNVSGQSDGFITYELWMNDSANNVATNGSAFAITVDVNPPTDVITVPPTLANGSFSSSNWLFVNMTFTEGNPQSCWTYLTNATGSFNLSMTRDGVNCYLNITGQSDGFKNYAIWVNDTSGNAGTNGTVFWATIDTAAPASIITVPPTLSSGSFTKNNWLSVNITFTEANPSLCWLTYNNGSLANYSMTRVGTNCYLNLTDQPDGEWNYSIWVNDTAGLTATNGTLFWANIDTTAPTNIATVLPTLANNTNSSNNWVFINFTFTETNFNSCWIQWNNGSYLNITAISSGNSCYHNLTGQPDGIWNYALFVNDTAGNTGANTSFFVGVDANPPSNLRTVAPTPANGSYTNRSWVTVNFTFTEFNPNICWLYWNNGSAYNISTASVNNWCYFNVSGQSDGLITYELWMNDTSNNIGTNGSTFAITVDTTPAASITTTPPTLSNTSATGRSWVFINFTFIETNFNSCWIQWNNGSYMNITASSSGNSCYLNITDQPDGYWDYKLFVNDSANNIGSNGTFFITVDTTYPQLQFDPSTLHTNANISRNWFLVNIT